MALGELRRIVAALLEGMRPGPDPAYVPRELLLCAATLGFFVFFFLFLWRFQSLLRKGLL